MCCRLPYFALPLALLLAGLGLTALLPRRAPAPALDDHGPVGEFALTSAGGQPFESVELAGRVWVVAFTFTRCSTTCPQVSGTMARLQHTFATESDFRLVTITVDPEHDAPCVLCDYATRYGADLSRWHFLTGKQEDVYRIVRERFLVGVEQNEGATRTPGNEVTHSTRLALVDRRGHLRGYFDGASPDPETEFAQLQVAVTALLREAP